MTTSSQTLTQDLPVLADGSPAPSRFTSLLRRVAELRCQLHGHDPMLRAEGDRLYLLCPTCGVESPGWQLDRPAPRVRQAGAADRFDRYTWHAGQATSTEAQ
jgi:hypothetical protein